MANRYPKHILVIAGNQIDIGNDITIEEDLDRTFQTLSFTLPWFDTGSYKLTDVKKYDSVKVYFNYFDTHNERQNATLDNTSLYFDGYIDEFSSSENKTDGLQYNIECKTTLGLSYERGTETKAFNDTPSSIVQKGLSETQLTSSIPYLMLSPDIDEVPLRVDSSQFLGEVLDSIRDKYAIKVYQISSGGLNIRTPSYFNIQEDTSPNTIELGGGRSIRQLQGYEYSLDKNIFNIDYGTPSNNINCVVVYGNNSVGIAYDPVAYQLMIGEGDTLTPDAVTPDPQFLNPIRLFRRDLFGEEACQKVAKQKLIDYAKNYTITFATEFLPEQQVGDLFRIRNSRMIRQQQKWIIKRRTITLNKEDINCQIVAYSNSLADFPDDILLSSTGILDTDILGVTDKVQSTIG